MCPNNVNRIGSRRGPILSVDVMVFQRAEIPGRAVIPHRALLQAASRVCPDAPAMVRELVALQRRLGTPAERAGDQERINFIALQLSRLVYAAFVLDDEEREGGVADDSAAG